MLFYVLLIFFYNFFFSIKIMVRVNKVKAYKAIFTYTVDTFLKRKFKR